MRVRRALKGWDGPVWQPSLAVIELDASYVGMSDSAEDYPATDRTVKAMNPAHIIYECLTNRVWGRGLARTMLDEASFLVAAGHTCLDWL